MAVNTRLMALVLGAVALALTVTGVVIAATNSPTGSLAKDPLRLDGYPPSSANLLVTVSGGADFGLSANVNVNFKSDKVDAVVRIPFIVTDAAVELRLMNHHIYARSANESSGPWLDAHLTMPSLFGVALELTKPDIRLITGFHKTVTTSGYSTTYVFYRKHVALTSLFGPSTAPSVLGSVRWSITVGSQGEASKTTLSVHAKKATTTLSVTVLSYNAPTVIATPTDVKPLSLGEARQLLSSEDFASLLIPRSLTSLSQASLS